MTPGPDMFVIDLGSGSYHGPVTLVAWMFIHPWMTFFILMSIFSALEELAKASGRRGRRK